MNLINFAIRKISHISVYFLYLKGTKIALTSLLSDLVYHIVI